MTTDLILGTAGHIDHGKTSLIRALTDVDTDRLPEEKKRGITIELGFAHLELGPYRLGIVDVPGHERFVRNMLAGATGMDLALLVVAADDSIKPQTREHLEILRLLQLRSGVIALTKCDLVEAAWTELVEEEIRELVQDTFLAEAPLVCTSTADGRGLERLKEELASAAQRAASVDRLARAEGPLRMPVDRAFTVAGHGTVVTGSISSGRMSVGDELVLEPGHVKVRVRGLQNHDQAVESVQRGQRAAVNLVGVHHEATQRGQELCSPGHLRPSRRLTVELNLLETTPRPLKQRSRVRLHLGAMEVLSSVRLLDRELLVPGESGLAQLFLREEAVAVWSQPFVVRSESPIATIGGGRVLEPDARRIRKASPQQLEMLRNLTSAEPLQRASAALYRAGLRGWQPEDLPRTAGIELFENAYQDLQSRGDIVEIEISPTRRVRLHRLVFAQLCDRVATLLDRAHDAFPLRASVDKSLVLKGLKYIDDAVVIAALKAMQAEGRVKVTPKGVGLAGRGPKLSKNEQKLLGELVEVFQEAGIQPPSVKDCQKRAQKHQASVPQLLALAAANGELVEISSDMYLHPDVEHACRQQLADELGGSAGLTVSQIREILNTTRKYVVPFCEYLDRVGFTKRQGDLRVLASSPD